MKNTIFLASVVLICISFCYGGTYGGGTGYPSSPYIISSPEHLNQIGLNHDDWDKCFMLTADIDMAGYTGTDYNIIGNLDFKFSGSFEGNGHTISNFTYTTANAVSYVGLFGIIDGGVVRNLSLKNVNISSAGNEIGAIAGNIYWGTIEYCSVTGSISGGNNSQNVGGIAGSAGNTAAISYSSVNAAVSGLSGCSGIGGLVGSCIGNVNRCYSSGTVKGGTSATAIGGLVGFYANGSYGNSIVNSYSICSVESGGYNTGGLVGSQQNMSSINGCFSAGDVKGTGYVGGLVGISSAATEISDSIVNSYSVSNVTISSTGFFAGGLVGYSGIGQIIDCYATGNVTGGSNKMGGLVGTKSSGKITNCFAKGNVTAGTSASNIGGLAGELMSWVMIDNCGSTGSVSAQGSYAYGIGGLVGSQSSGSITNCYSLGSVAGGLSSSYVGGLVGGQNYDSSATISKCFSAGAVSGGSGSSYYVGGLIGKKSSMGTVITSFWDTQTSGQPTSDGGKGKTTADMQNSTTFISAGWDFVGETPNGTADIWEMRGYPAFAFQSAIDTIDKLAASVTVGNRTSITFDISNITNESFIWAIYSRQAAEWIADISPSSGSLTGLNDSTSITINIHGDGLGLGNYGCELLITTSTGDETIIPLILTVFNRVDIEDLAAMGDHWNTLECDFGQDCKAFDWYVDGAIDQKDLMRLIDSWLCEDVEMVMPTIEDGFETGDFTALNWETAGDLPWTVVTSDKYQGSYAAKSGAIGHSQYSAISLSVNTTGWQVDTIGFAYSVSSEYGYDYMRFYIDGAEKFNYSGHSGWQTTTLPITPGQHTFRWVYSKDSDGSSAPDCALIDNIRIYAK